MSQRIIVLHRRYYVLTITPYRKEFVDRVMSTFTAGHRDYSDDPTKHWMFDEDSWSEVEQLIMAVWPDAQIEHFLSFADLDRVDSVIEPLAI